jgi:hypothetical protein
MRCCLIPLKNILGRRSKSTTAIPDGGNEAKDRKILNKFNPDTLTEGTTQQKTTKSDKNQLIKQVATQGTVNANKDNLGSFLSTSDDDEETRKVFNQSWNPGKNSQYSQAPQETQNKVVELKTENKIVSLVKEPEKPVVDVKIGTSNIGNEKNNETEKSKVIQNLKQEIKSLHSIIHRLNYEINNSNKPKPDNTILASDGNLKFHIRSVIHLRCYSFSLRFFLFQIFK